jgi:PAS domain S-box-containing protein
MFAGADALIALAYFAIAAGLLYYLRKRSERDTVRVAGLLAAVLLVGASAHVVAAWSLRNLALGLDLLASLVSALLSAIAAVVVVRLLRRSARQPSAARLRQMNEALRLEVEGRAAAEGRLMDLLETERAAANERLRAFFEAAPQAMLGVRPNGEIMLVNRQAEQLFGYRREELTGMPLLTLIPERFRAVHGAHQRAFFEDPGVRPMGSGRDLYARRKDGTEFPVEVGLSFADTEEGRFALALVTDITVRKRHEQELAETNRELRRTNEELEQFTYAASHDLQEPLRMVTNYMQLLERRTRDQLDGDAREFLQFAADGARRMRELIQDLLRLSRAGTKSLELRPIPAALSLETAMLNLRGAIEEAGARIVVGDLPVIEADAGLMAQVFQNLIANALKFRGREPPEIHISASQEAGSWVFSVKDNGIGIDPAHAERIFRMFERLHGVEEYSGSGVGLAIAKRVVERHGGRIWVESNIGTGATFRFSLPARLARPAAAFE